MTDVIGKGFQVDTCGAENLMAIIRVNTATLDTIESYVLGAFRTLDLVHLLYYKSDQMFFINFFIITW